jgi:hypothetical protein
MLPATLHGAYGAYAPQHYYHHQQPDQEDVGVANCPKAPSSAGRQGCTVGDLLGKTGVRSIVISALIFLCVYTWVDVFAEIYRTYVVGRGTVLLTGQQQTIPTPSENQSAQQPQQVQQQQQQPQQLLRVPATSGSATKARVAGVGHLPLHFERITQLEPSQREANGQLNASQKAVYATMLTAATVAIALVMRQC